MEPESWEEALGVSESVASGAGGDVKCFFIINFVFLLFLVFHGGGGVGDKFAIS